MVPFGAELTFVEDPSIKVTVLDDRHILYNKETTSMSALAKRLKKVTHPLQGTLFFKYNGEILNNLREKLGK